MIRDHIFDNPVLIHPSAALRMALMNSRSITNKTFVLNYIIQSKKFEFLFVTETWQRNMEHTPLIELYPRDYTFIILPRVSGRGGGLAAMFRSHFSCRLVKTVSLSSFEIQMIKIGCTLMMF